MRSCTKAKEQLKRFKWWWDGNYSEPIQKEKKIRKNQYETTMLIDGVPWQSADNTQYKIETHTQTTKC